MAVLSTDSVPHDSLLPWLLSVKKTLDNLNSETNTSTSGLEKLLSDCISTFKYNNSYRNDTRFLKIWFLYLDCTQDFDTVYREIEESQICVNNALLYEGLATFLEAKGQLIDALMIYRLGISRNAEPVERLKNAQSLFLERVSEIVNVCSNDKTEIGNSIESGKTCINPWSVSTIKDLLQKVNRHLSKYDGYHMSTKAYSGKVALSTLQNSSRNKMVEIGGRKYQIKGCAGQGGFAQVFKAYENSNPDDVVALKIQKPAFPWEFYMYRQLDMRISEKERSNFGFAHRMHLYSDYSILVCGYLSHGTLQDAINSYVVTGAKMEEVLSMYYTIEMLHMLETLHKAGVIHGDFKPDNLLIRYARDDLKEEDFQDRTGPWCHQGLCLVDWGRGIDLSLFPENIVFEGDSRTSGFRCIEMQEHRPWTYQVDTYGLCVIVHMMLHNSYMEIKKIPSHDGSFIYVPKLPFKRYWNVELWENLFRELLNANPDNDHKELLQTLRNSFEDYLSSNPQLIKKLKQLLLKQRTSFLIYAPVFTDSSISSALGELAKPWPSI
ncbi:Mad3/Bub1 homology region 1, partial [Dillenia turbinata]